MKLFYRKLGQGQPIIILHGLFGSSDNWQTLGKQFAGYKSDVFPDGLEIFLVDQRNHGLSPHDPVWNYEVMSDDLLELINSNHLEKPIVIGHSMGGKTAMRFAQEHPHVLSKLIVVDIGPKYYPVHHDLILNALCALELEKLKSRNDAETELSKHIHDFPTRQFLLKNLYWKEDPEKKLAWRFNLEVISKNIEAVGEALSPGVISDLPALFMRGEKSHYLLDDDMSLIATLFPNASFETIANAGHWIHAEQPKAFFEAVINFVESYS